MPDNKRRDRKLALALKAFDKVVSNPEKSGDDIRIYLKQVLSKIQDINDWSTPPLVLGGFVRFRRF